jgi:hypothetical protein
MALILEQFDPRHPDVVHRRITLDADGLTFGRALDNQVVIDDPHVDGHHGRLAIEPDGTLVLVDLGSVNGLELVGSGRVPRIALVHGLTLRFGKTSFRVTDPHAEVVAAIPLPLPSAAAHHDAWVERPLAGVGLALLLAGWGAWGAYHSHTTTNAGIVALTAFIGVVVLVAAWAGGWALLGRLLGRRPRFLTHVAIGSALFLATSAGEWAHGWADFLWPWDVEAWDVAAGAVFLASIVIGMVVHLSYATALTVRQRWVSVVTGAVLVLGLVAAGTALDEDPFTDVPSYSATLKYVTPAMVHTVTSSDFNRAAGAARRKADEEAGGAEEN